MRSSAVLTISLAVLLVGTNLFWINAFQPISQPTVPPAPLSCSAAPSEFNAEIAAPLARAIAAAALPGANKQSILRAANGDTNMSPLTCTNDAAGERVRGIALFFDSDDRLTNATIGACVQHY